MTPGAHTVASLLEAVCASFSAAPLSYGHGTDNAWDEAVALVLHVTGAADDRSQLQQAVAAADAAEVLRVAEQRIVQRQPLAYLLGGCRYQGLALHLAAGVVVPRSPIGYLLAERLQPWLTAEVHHVLDLCSGSGCLGILAATLFPQAQVTLLELDATAVAVAKQNVRHHQLGGRVQVVQADATHSWPEAASSDGCFDLILCNPPYVNAADMASLPLEYRAEPAMGLAAGDDGLAIMLPVLAQLPGRLQPGGLFVGEVGGSAPALLSACADLPFIWPDLHRGGEGVFLLAGNERNSHTADRK